MDLPSKLTSFSMEEKDPNDAYQVACKVAKQNGICAGMRTPTSGIVITRTITFFVGDAYKPSHHWHPGKPDLWSLFTLPHLVRRLEVGGTGWFTRFIC